MSQDLDPLRFFWHEPERLATTRACVVGSYKNPQEKLSTLEHLQELQLLAETQHIPVVQQYCFSIRMIKAATFLTEGKLEELQAGIQEQEINLVIFDDEISPSQQRNLEQLFKVPVIDRTEVILGVFAMRAKTREAKLQVRLAEVKYIMPRLKRMWTHLSRQAGGGGGLGGGGYLKGEGEKQIEIDKRILKKQIEALQEDIKQIKRYRETQRALRAKTAIAVIAIVGYTNAGKSTLMNLLTNADVYTEDKLFATLDTTTRKYTLKNNQEVLFIDTVGFIRKLPHLLVAAFRSTLEEAVHADLILHVIDAKHPNAAEQAETTLAVLKELDAHDTPIITVLNKVDAVETLEEQEHLHKLRFHYARACLLSAKQGDGLDLLEQEIITQLENRRARLQLRIPQKEYHVLAAALREGKVFSQEYDENDVLVDVEVPRAMLFYFEQYKQHI